VRSEEPKDFGLGLQELPGASPSHRSRLQAGVQLWALEWPLPSLLLSHPQAQGGVLRGAET
jgi:hypothetical protein